MNSESKALTLNIAFWSAILAGCIPPVWFHVSSFRPLAAYGMGWIPLLSLAAFMVCTWWRWDKALRLPRDRSVVLLLGLAVVCVAIAALTLRPWLGGLAVGLVAIGFLWTHSSGVQQTALVLTWPCLISFVCVPPMAEPAGLAFLTPVLVESVDRMLLFLEVPHVAYPHAVSWPGRIVFFDELLASFWSVPLFIFSSCLLSVGLKRTSLEALFNLAATIPAFLLFSPGVVATSAFLATSPGHDSQGGYQRVLVLLSWGVITLITYLSCEHLYRTILWPISKFYWPTKSNPFVVYWNRLSRHQPRSTTAVPPTWIRGVALLIAGLLLAASVLQVVSWGRRPSQNPSAIAQLASPQHTASGREVLHRTLALRSPKAYPHRLELWTHLHPLVASELCVLNERLERPEVVQIVASQGWKTHSLHELTNNPASWSAQFDTSRPVVSLLRYVGTDGRVMSDPTNIEETAMTVHLIAEFAKPPSVDDLEQLNGWFAEILATRQKP